MNYTFLLDILKNPIVLAAILAVVRNLTGYIANIFKARQKGEPLPPYQASQLLETFTLWEGLFILLQGVGSLPTNWTVALVLGADILRSFKKVLEA